MTGANRSDILGRLGVLGNANLFLINPKGIVFGPSSSLDVQGSFLATTADAVKLGDVGLFSASQPAMSNLLTVSPSAFWFNAIAAQPIVNTSQAQSLIGQPNSADGPPGLQVRAGQTLALVGGNVLLEGGRLTAAGGRIELGSVAGVGQVSLTQSGNRFVLGYDSINDFGNISLSNRAKVNASDSGETNSTGLPSGIFNTVGTEAMGNGGDINIITGTLSVRGGAQLLTRTSGRGNAGNVTIHAGSTVSLAGFSGNTMPTIGSDVSGMEAVGNGGDIKITAPSVFLQNEAILAASILRGRGENGRPAQAGNVTITASDQVSLNNSRVYSEVRSGSVGNSGTININAPFVSLDNRATLVTQNGGSGNGGDIKAGDIIVNATQSVNLNQASLLAQSTDKSPSAGAAGEIRINTGQLTARNGTITTSSEQSSGGDITIIADKIRLFGDSDISTNVNSGAGGGGKIDLTADSILAFDNSDILAFAHNGIGGDITLNTPAFFGENYRPAPRGTNPRTLNDNNRVDINAAGAVIGVITLPDLNSLTELPDTQLNTDSLLANSCIVRRNQPTRGSFTITGTGGLPQRPGDAQMSSFPTVDVATLPSDSTPSTTNPNRFWQKGNPIVEPQGVYRLSNGKLVLSRECS